jgi:hypothetical protein
VIPGKTGYLRAGDTRHFDHLYGRRIVGVLVVRRRSISGAAKPLKRRFHPTLSVWFCD